MKILLLSPLFPPDTGGSATAFHLLFRHLCSDDSVQTVWVLCETDTGRPRIERLNAKGRLLRFLPPLGRISGYDKRNPVWKAYLVLRRSLVLLLLLPILTRIFEADVIHFHATFGHINGRYRNLLFEWALKLSRGRKVCDVQDRRARALHSSLADMFIANSMKIKDEMDNSKNLRGARIEYLPVPIALAPARGGTNISETTDRILPQDAFFCFVGDLWAPKGLYPLLAAHRQLLKSSSYRLSMVMIGRDKTGGWIRGCLDDRTIWLGMLPHSDVLHAIERSRFLILPSFSEGIPRVCLEALALGIPIVYPPDIEEFNKYIPAYMLPEITPEAIKEMIQKMLSGNHSQHYPIHHHDARLLYERLRTLYRECLSSGEPAGF
ncbi:glycosyltransferase family 4 protein [Thermodesulfobacteriota bacterium]